MRLNIVRSTNATSYYVIKDYIKNGKRTSKVHEKLGTHEQILEKCGNLDPETWARAYVEELNRKEKQEQLEYIARYSSSKMIKKDQQRQLKAGYLFLQQVYHQLKLDKICQEIEGDYKFKYVLSDILNMLVTTRILHPSSKKSSLACANNYLEKPNFKVHQIYRALEVLAANSDYLQSELYKHSKSMVKRNDKILYYDCTNYYFEIEEEEEGLKQYGASKENRPNPIVQMGLFLDADGLPLAFNLFSGNENEQPSPRPLEERILKDFKLSQFVVCTDAGLSSHENRLFNSSGERAFITTQSLKKLKDYLREWALDPTGWRLGQSDTLYDLSQIDLNADEQMDKLYYKSRWVKEKGLQQQLVVSFSAKYKRYSETLREGQIERAFKKLQTPGSMNKKRPNDPKRFIKQYSVTEDGEMAQRDVYYLDEKAIAKEAQYDGFYAVCTNLEDEPLDIIAVNKGRWEIEAAFRIMKSELKARPVYLKRDDRIKAHFLTCFIALLIYRILVGKVQLLSLQDKPSGEKIIETLREMNFLEKEGDGYIPSYKRTDITDHLHQVAGFRTDYELVPIKTMKNIVKMTRKNK